MIINVDYHNKQYNLIYLFMKITPDIFYPLIMKYIYKKKYSENLNLKNPQKLSEKLIWSCLYDKNPMKKELSDKLKAKEYISKKLPELSTAKVYQVAEKFEELDFSSVPNKFVIKTNHAWKTGILIEDKDKINVDSYNSLKKFYEKALSLNYAYWGTIEKQYKDIKPKIFLEEYLTLDEKPLIKEYEIYCFRGKPEFINYMVSYTGSPPPVNDCSVKQSLAKLRVFYPNWEPADFEIKFSHCIPAPDSPNRNLALKYAEILSKDFDFVRIDLFEVGDKLYFGEFTFTPQAGLIDIKPAAYDLFYGQKL